MAILKPTQQKIYSFIRDFIEAQDYSPTISEIAAGVGLKSKGVVHRHLQQIIQADLLTLIPNQRRNIRLTETANHHDYSIPLLGKIAAGRPLEAIQSDATINMVDMFIGKNRYALKVVGDSMINDGIFDDDIVICEKTNVAMNGDIVVALIDQQEVTLKRLHQNPEGTITLIPANARLSPMVYQADRVTIQGKFIGLLRLGA